MGMITLENSLSFMGFILVFCLVCFVIFILIMFLGSFIHDISKKTRFSSSIDSFFASILTIFHNVFPPVVLLTILLFVLAIPVGLVGDWINKPNTDRAKLEEERQEQADQDKIDANRKASFEKSYQAITKVHPNLNLKWQSELFQSLFNKESPQYQELTSLGLQKKLENKELLVTGSISDVQQYKDGNYYSVGVNKYFQLALKNNLQTTKAFFDTNLKYHTSEKFYFLVFKPTKVTGKKENDYSISYSIVGELLDVYELPEPCLWRDEFCKYLGATSIR